MRRCRSDCHARPHADWSAGCTDAHLHAERAPPGAACQGPRDDGRSSDGGTGDPGCQRKISASGTPTKACDCTAILANEDGGHPHRPLPATRTREAPAPLSPRDIAQQVNVDAACHHLNVVVAGRGHGIDDLLAGPPLTGVRPDVDSIRTPRKHAAKPPRIARILRIQHLIERRADLLLHPSPRPVRHPLSSAARKERGPAAGTGQQGGERNRSSVSTHTLLPR
jgi:hypothetical protein